MDLILLKLAAAHFVAWGRVQRRDWVPGGSYSFRRALGGAGTYAVLALVFIALGSMPQGTDWPAILLLIGLTAFIRLATDVICAKSVARSWASLLTVQVSQLTLICTLPAIFLDPGRFLAALWAALNSPATYGIVATYAVSVWLGGALVRLVTGLLPPRTQEERIGMDGAGSIIGILERLLVTSFVLFWPAFGAAAIGLIFSAKSIARFPEMGKEDGARFAEYYLVGTLTSFTVAIGAGMIARSYLLG